MSFLYGCPDDCIRTFSGNIIDLKNPDPDKLIIEDIAHALSNICRFGGHVPKYYSVAEHCLNAMAMGAEPLKIDFLMHDCSEAYLHDIMRPVKQLLTDYKALEDVFMERLAKKFKFCFPLAREVVAVDNQLLFLEYDIMMRGVKAEVKFSHYVPEVAEALFLNAYHSLQ